MKFRAAEILNPEGYIQEGCLPTPDLLLLVTTLGRFDAEEPRSEVVWLMPEKQYRFKLIDDALMSIGYSANGHAYAVGRDATLIRFRYRDIESERQLKNSVEIFENEKAFKTGPIKRLRMLGSAPVYFGAFGQLFYLNDNSILVELPPLDIYSEPVIIQDIAGAAVDDFVAVTMSGHAASFNGEEWLDLALPTNLPFSAIVAIDTGNYAICGYGANIFVGRDGTWTKAPRLHKERKYYGVSVLEGKIYAAHIGGVDCFDGREVVQIAIADPGDYEFAVLHEAHGSVWSFCGKTVGRITNDVWETVVEP